MNVVITEEYNVVVNSEELFGTTEYLTQYVRCRIKRYRYTRVLLYFLRLTLRLLMSYIYGAPILDVSRSHTTTQHNR